MSIDAWSAAVARLVTTPVRHDPSCAIGFTQEARDAGWLEVSSPWDFGFGPGMPSSPDLEWGLFAVHPGVRRVALELRVGGTTVTSCRIGLWSEKYPVLMILRSPSISSPNWRTDWPEITREAESVARMAAVGGDAVGFSHVTTLLDSAMAPSDVGCPE